MKKIFNILFIGIGLAATSCSELPEYELPYELEPTTEGSLSVNALCPGPIATFTVDSESTVYYAVVVNDPEVEPLTSKEIWDRKFTIPFDGEGSKEISIDGFIAELRTVEEFFVEGLELGVEYTVSAVTVNVDGMRSEEVMTSTLTMPSFEELMNGSVATEYTATAYIGETPVTQMEIEFTNEGNTVFEVVDLWGDFVAVATGNPDYEGQFPFPATITVDPTDLSLTLTSESENIVGGAGTYDPCTGNFHLTTENAIFNPPADIVEIVLTPIVETPGA